MEKLCKCGEEPYDETTVQTLHQGLEILITDRAEDNACLECCEHRLIEKFNALNLCKYELGPLIETAHGHFYINWSEFVKRLSHTPEDTTGIRALRMAGLLKFDPTNAWDIVADGHPHVGPIIGTVYYYFAFLDLAKEYAQSVIGLNRTLRFIHVDQVVGK